MKTKLIWFVICFGICFFGGPVVVAGSGIDSPQYWAEGHQRISALGDGYVVWESNRTGRWRIFTRRLDFSGFRQLTGDEANRDHYCPHISPDGSRVVYLSYPSNLNTYQKAKADVVCPLRIVNIDGTGDRVLVANARAYGEDRAVVWIDDDNLIYIGPDEFTYRLKLSSGESELLVNKAPSINQWTQGWLLDATLRYATTGQPSFSRYEAEGMSVRAERNLGGCQPYFTADGRWGFWTAGAGGPINRIDLESRKIDSIIIKNDPILPRERSYLYFPMISRDRRLFTFGASPNQHDHFKSDYAIFIVPLDPDTLSMIGRPVRYTFDRGCDRFSDVFLYPLPLGQEAGKAPFTVKLSHPDLDSATASVDFGDGRSIARHRGAISQTYDKPGTYTIVATVGETELRGMVRVMPAAPPKLEGALLVEPDAVRLIFNEPINARRARFRLGSGIAVSSTSVSADGRSMMLQLGRPVAEIDSLRIEGIADLAQRPNIMPVTSVDLRPLIWPVNRNGLVLLLAGREDDVIVADDGPRACNLTLRGKSYVDNAGGLVMRGGSIIAEEAAAPLLKACRESNEFTIQVLFRPAGSSVSGPARIVSFSTDYGQRNFTLGQERERIVLRLRTPATGVNGLNPEVTIGNLRPGELSHVVITYKPGQLTAYLNGEKVNARNLSGDFSNWNAQHVMLGNERTGDRPWLGTINQVAIFSRCLDEAEVMANFQALLSLHNSRAIVSRATIRAKLVETSTRPDLLRIAPYRAGLVTYLYEVERHIGGDLDPAAKQIRVAHWAWLDGEAVADLPKQGQSVQLEIEALSDNPQLSALYRGDDLDIDPDAKVYFDISRP